MNFSPDDSAELPLVQKSAVAAAEDRLWIALQYILSELDETAAAEFESLLERDLSYCESLVEATRIVAALSETCSQFHQRTATDKHGQNSGDRRRFIDADCVSEEFAKTSLPPSSWNVASHAAAFDASSKFRGLAVSIALAACGFVLLTFSGLNGLPSITFVGHSAVDREGAVAARALLSLYVADDPVFGASAGFGSDDLESAVEDPEFMVPEWLFAAVELESSVNADGRSSSKSSVTPDSDLSDEEFDSEIF